MYEQFFLEHARVFSFLEHDVFNSILWRAVALLHSLHEETTLPLGGMIHHQFPIARWWGLDSPTAYSCLKIIRAQRFRARLRRVTTKKEAPCVVTMWKLQLFLFGPRSLNLERRYFGSRSCRCKEVTSRVRHRGKSGSFRETSFCLFADDKLISLKNILRW